MAHAEILAEFEKPGGWDFDAQVLTATGALIRHTVHLNWADYNLWSASGSDEPAAVAIAVLEFLYDEGHGATLRDRFDASLARRLSSNADAMIPPRIGIG